MDKAPPLIAYAIPIFFLLIGIELLLGQYSKKRLYRLNDALNNLTMGIYSRLSGIFIQGFIFYAYFHLYHTIFADYRLLHLSLDGIGPAMLNLSWTGTTAAVFVCALTFFLVDHQYYWFHRMSHQVAIIWGSHEPHHQSEEYNLAVALRQGSFQGFFSAPFYLPLAVLGVDIWVFLVFRQLNTIYQFWVHTRLVGKLGFLEWFLNTPSHHRVHHGVNPKYIDKNHAGTLIIWDMMYGTFQAEEEEPVYGTVKPLQSWNPIWANVQYWWSMLKLMVAVPGMFDKLKVIYKPPGWKPASMGAVSEIPEASRETFHFYNPDPGPGWKSYCFVQFLVGLFAMVFLLYLGITGQAITPIGIVSGLISFWTLLAVGILFEGRRSGHQLEWTRLAALAGGLVSQWQIFSGNEILIGLGVVYVLISGIWLWRLTARAGSSLQSALA